MKSNISLIFAAVMAALLGVGLVACTQENPDCPRATCGALSVDPVQGVQPCNAGCTDEQQCLDPNGGECDCVSEMGGECLEYEQCECVAVLPACGDGNVDPGEECDDGNVNDGDGCDHLCQTEPVLPACGDGNVDPGEECDDGNVNDGDGCDHLCQTEPVLPAECAVMGIYFPNGGHLRVESGDGEVWDGEIPPDWTVPISIDESDLFARVWVFAPSLSMQSGSSVTMWAPGVAPPAWPAGPGFPIQNFNWTPDGPSWANFRLQCSPL
jgi:cysteine-rich repeat protein